jgi:hypothetical protein
VIRAAGAFEGDLGGGGIDFAEVFGGEFDGGCAEVLFEAREFPGAGDGSEPGLLGEEPGDEERAGGGI